MDLQLPTHFEAARNRGFWLCWRSVWGHVTRIREGLSTDERERLRELERENARLRMLSVAGEGVERVMLYRFVDAQKAEGFPVRARRNCW